MKKRLRILALLFVTILPGFAKRFVYQWCFGYRIGRGVRIGLAYLDCVQLTIHDGVRISHGVVFVQCGEVHIGQHAIIGPLNLFRGGTRIQLGDYSLVLRLNVINAIPDHDCINDPDSSFSLGYGSVVTAEHRLDFTARISIGRCTTFGGRNSSIWTHNRRIGLPVEIGSYCYVGSEIRMAPGSSIQDCCIVGLGSVVTHPVNDGHALIAGVPAKKQRTLTQNDYELIFGKTRPDLPDEVYPAPLAQPIS